MPKVPSRVVGSLVPRRPDQRPIAQSRDHRPQGMGIAKRLALMSGVLIFALMLVAALVVALLQPAITDAEEVRSMRAPQLVVIADIELNVTRASLQVRHAMLARNPQELQSTLADIEARVKHIQLQVEAYIAGEQSEAGRDAARALPQLMNGFVAAATANIELVKAGQKDEAMSFLVDRTIPARNAFLAPLGGEKTRHAGAMDTDLGEIASEARLARNIVLVSLVVVAAALVGFCIYVVRIVQKLGAEPDQLKQVADAVAAGDLSTSIPVREGDTATIVAALQTMRDNLARTVQSVRDNADSVAVASAEIAQGNNDLSHRTEQQASSLQHTSAQMEQLATTVRQNADNAAQANQLATGASQVAERGGATVREVVDTMRGINDSSRKIADIIGVIDGIAFQTNILALNAAVEAARAGEQGRGFAVVAGEVRSLAQRSAGAAKEIKDLIGASVQRVEQGVVLVDKAGNTMQEIVVAIQRVTDIVGEISQASTEQAQSVQTIGSAVQQMDQATQQNAALVEQSAAAASSLNQRSQELVQSVAVFKL
jgi:methyl-accepting chemotaxis protein